LDSLEGGFSINGGDNAVDNVLGDIIVILVRIVNTHILLAIDNGSIEGDGLREGSNAIAIV
jgi:hypothetical protein